MSFSQKTKNELARITLGNRCCQLAELAALIKMGGKVQIGADYHLFLAFETNNAAIARRVFSIVKNLFNLKTEVGLRQNKRFNKNNIYSLSVLPQPGTKKLFKELGVNFKPAGYEIQLDTKLIKKTCCQKAYLRGAFLGGGSLTNPGQGTYHLEITTPDKLTSEHTSGIMKNFGLRPKTVSRKNATVIYIKNSQQIVDFLNIIGAHSALLFFEGIRVHKDVKNRVNRLVNCETANLNRTVEAGLKQVETIRFLQKTIGLENLPPGLKAPARLRLKHPEATLKELGEMMDPPLSKSGMNHCMRRLRQIADKIKGC